MSGNIRKSDNTIDPQNQMSGGSNHLGLLTSKRVSVLREGQVVPLLPGRPVMDSTQSPWNGLYLEKFDLDALHISEHEHGTYFLRMHSSKRVEMDWKSSGRSGHTAVDEGSLLFLTPGTYDSLNWHGPAQPIVVSIDPLLLKQMADQMELRGLPEFTNLGRLRMSKYVCCSRK